jgi:putative aldouronate transport system substrate-binding protein
MNFNKFKITAALLCFLAVFTLAACDGAQQAPEQTATPTPSPTQEVVVPYSEHLELYFMPRKASNPKAALSRDDATIKFLEEKYNLTFNIVDVSSEDEQRSYGEILTSLIASAMIPDFMDMDVLGQNATEYSKLVESGIASDVGEFMSKNAQDYPLLLYCLPHYVAPDDTVYLVRGDWVEKAGYTLSDIDTLEEFAELMNIFVEEDFDGKKAVGFTTSTEKYLYPIYCGYTGAYMFREQDGYYVDWYTTYELRESLGYIYLMYKTGAFDREYLSHDGTVSKDKITTGQAGCVATEIANLPLLNAELKENIPDGYLEPLPVTLSGPGGSTRFTDKSYPSANVISIYFEDPARIYDMCEYIFTDEGRELVSYGIEGVHFTRNGEDIAPDYAAYEAEGWKYKADGSVESVQTFNEIRNIITNFEVVETPEYSKTAAEWYASLLNYDAIHSNPFEDNGFNNSKVYASMTSVKDKWVDDFISGSELLTDKNWDEFVSEYLSAGAQDQMDFYNNR